MTRELKFREWAQPNKKYYFFPEEFLGVKTQEDKRVTLAPVFEYDVIEQYTGLKDKNGKEIYEGDIIDYNSDGKAIGYVKYNAPHYELIDKEGYTMFLKGAPHQTIIGNIHENPELLGQNNGEKPIDKP